jgi:hypothetical protein
MSSSTSWVRIGLWGHDGSIQGLIEEPPGILRPLTRLDLDGLSIPQLRAACSCGWRSERFRASQPAAWMFGMVEACETDVRRVHELWTTHANEAAQKRLAR